MSPYAHWTAMTDTREMPTVRRGVPVTDQPTEVLHLLDLRPTVQPTHRRRRARFITREDLAASWRAAWLSRALAAGLLVLAFLTATRPLGELLLAVSTGGHL